MSYDPTDRSTWHYAVFVSGTNDQLTDPMTRAECHQWAEDAYADGETRVLAIYLAETPLTIT